jgi:signal transduction histidine kinase
MPPTTKCSIKKNNKLIQEISMERYYSSRLSNISEILSILIIIAGIVFLIGWALNIPILKSPGSIFSTIKSNVALCFVFIGISLWLMQTKRINQRNIRIAKILAIIVTFIGLLTLIEHLTGYNYGIDQILFTELPGAINTSSPNRMAFNAALSLVLVGSSILVLDKDIKIGWPLFQIIIIIEGLITFLAALGYAYQASDLYMVYNYTGIAIYATLIFGLIFFAIVFMRPDKGFIGLLQGESPGSVLGRKILPFVIAIPVILGWLNTFALNKGFYDIGLGNALLIFATVMVITTLLWRNIISINKTDLKRRKAEEAKQKLLEQIQLFAEELQNTNEELQVANEELQDTTEELQVTNEELQATTEELQASNEELQDTTEELQIANEELQQFAYAASHDLQEPLRTISSFTQLMQRRYAGQLDTDADEFMEYIVDGSKRMQQLINDLLEYTRVDTHVNEFKLVKLDNVIEDTLLNLKGSINENNAVITHDPLPTINADKGQLNQLFQNLISNAIKFQKPDEPPRIHISAKKEDDHYLFSVSDNGIGIEPQYTERVFVIFQRLHTRETYQGTGIGLSIVKRIVERHGGRIWVESEFGVGSTFYFTLKIIR